MNPNTQTHSAAWVTFTYISFAVSLFMVAVGIFFLPLAPWVKGSRHGRRVARSILRHRDQHARRRQTG